MQTIINHALETIYNAVATADRRARETLSCARTAIELFEAGRNEEGLKAMQDALTIAGDNDPDWRGVYALAQVLFGRPEEPDRVQYLVITGSPDKGRVIRKIPATADANTVERLEGGGIDKGHGPQWVVADYYVYPPLGATVRVRRGVVISIVEE